MPYPPWAKSLAFSALVLLSLLIFYTAYDKATGSLSLQKLLQVISFSDFSFSLRELNKIFALGGLGLISVVFILGPLSKLSPKYFGRFLPLRKPIGLTGFALVVLHSAYSLVAFYKLDLGLMIFQNQKFLGFAAAVLAFLIFAAMSATSTPQAVSRMGYKKWKALQTFGYFGLFLSLLHFLVIESKPGAILDVRPYALVFFFLGVLALILRLIIILVKAPERKSYWEHLGGRAPLGSHPPQAKRKRKSPRKNKVEKGKKKKISFAHRAHSH